MTSSPSGSSEASLIHMVVIMIFVMIPVIAVFIIKPLNQAFADLYNRARGYFWGDRDAQDPAGEDEASERGTEDDSSSSEEDDDLDVEFYRE